jgi:ribosome maturation factor RimP
LTVTITSKEQELYDALEPVVEPLGVDLIDVELKTHGERPSVRVVIDNDDGVGSGVCSRVSESVSPVLDVEDPGFTGEYDLEVSSPGLERRLRRSGEYERFQGQAVEVTCYGSFKDQKKWIGTLTEYDGDNLIINPDDTESVSIPENNIASVRLHFDAEAALKSEGDQRDE